MNAAEIIQGLGGDLKSGWCLCPAHDDHDPSLHVEDKYGKTLWRCFAGCSQDRVTSELKNKGLIGANSGKAPKSETPPPWDRPIARTHIYEKDGVKEYRKVKFADGLHPKYQICAYDGGKETWKKYSKPMFPYHIDKLADAIAKGVVAFVPEGEADVETLEKLGQIATTNATGGGNFTEADGEYLRGAKLVVALEDNDSTGKKHGEAVGKAVYEKALAVKVIRLPDLPPKGDVTDWLEAGHTIQELNSIVFGWPEWKPPEVTAQDASPDIAEDDGNLPPGLSEDALAAQFTELHGADLRYTALWGGWHEWDGQRWKEDSTLHVFDLARSICKGAASNPDLSIAQVNRISSAKTVAAIVTLARSDRKHAAIADQWDSDIWALNTPGGVVDLRTGEIRPAQRTDHMTKITAAAPEGECPIFLAMLQHITRGDQHLTAYLQRSAGYMLTGSVREETMWFIYGEAQAGKTKFVEALAGVLGDYAKTADMGLLTENKHEQHPTGLADLYGARLVYAAETEEGRRWAEARIKAMTGGDRLKARKMRKDFFEFHPIFKLLVYGNYRPRLRNPDKAMRRRFHMVPFDNVVPPEMRDDNLKGRLQAEYGGILQWMVEGCLAWQREGLNPPPAVIGATDNYFAEEDALGRWIAEECDVGSGFNGRATQLYEAWKLWAEKMGEFPGKARRFWDELEKREFSKDRDNQSVYYLGISPRKTESV